jgi:GTPase SAR1 family protein
MSNNSNLLSTSIPVDHPLYNPLDLCLWTPEIDRLLEVIKRWLWTGMTGGLIIGLVRVGKTTAIQTLVKRLEDRNGRFIPSYHLTIHRRDRRTINSLARRLCLSIGTEIGERVDSDRLINHFANYLMDLAVNSETNKIVLFVDEAQRLSIDQIDAFAELHDDLKLRGVVLVVIFTGNDRECDHLVQGIVNKEKDHLLGRFFTQKQYFNGIVNIDGVKSCLQQYDTLRHPDENSPTYTESFLSDDFQNGWRLVNAADYLWRGYTKYRKNLKLKSWGMQYFVNATNILLIDYLPEYGVDSLSDEMVDECIKLSGLIESVVENNGA